MSPRAALTLGVLWTLSACNVATVKQAPSTIARNVCADDAECAGGVCDNKLCRARNGSFQSVLFEVTPPAEASSIAGVQYLKLLELPLTGGELPNGGLELELVAQLVGQVLLDGRKCTPQFDTHGTAIVASTDSSIPALVSLTPSTSALGLYSPHATVESALIKTSYYGFSVNIPPGNYDIYVEPEHQNDDSCPVPPQLLRAQTLRGTLKLGIKLPEPSLFEFHVTWPSSDVTLSDWFVDMLDPISGRVISNRVQLAPNPTEKNDYIARLTYSPVVGGTSQEKGRELVRLSPPAGRTAPTILLARSALGLFNADKGTLDQLTALPTPVHLRGQVTALSTPKPVAASVTLIATQIIGVDFGVLASFVRHVDVGDDGQFELDVLPGTYRVSAVPRVELNGNPTSAADSRLAEATAGWEVPSTPSNQAGKVIELNQALPINGQAFDASGMRPVATALVQAVASPASIQTDVLHQALGEANPVPRVSTTSVMGTGDFALIADPGTFDVTVRPLASTGFGWLVFPSVNVNLKGAGSSLGRQSIPLPVSYRGTVTVPGAEGPKNVPNALIRAYIYMKNGAYMADPSKADSVLQIAETRADDSGRFEVLIPAAVNPPPAPLNP